MWKYKRIQILYPIFCLFIAALAFFTGHFHWLLIVFFLFVWLLYITIGAFRLSSELFLNVISSGNKKSNIITLTFDDGPDPLITPQILALLKEFDVKAMFFCIGKKVEQYPHVMQAIAADGHIVANHSFYHSNFIGFASVQQVKEELEQTEKAIAPYQTHASKLFRPPFGVTNPNIAAAAEQLGYRVIGWNNRSFDTVSTNKERVLKRISTNMKGGDIVLFHDTISLTPLVLKEFMLLARDKGFTFAIHPEILHP